MIILDRPIVMQMTKFPTSACTFCGLMIFDDKLSVFRAIRDVEKLLNHFWVIIYYVEVVKMFGELNFSQIPEGILTTN